MREPKNGRLCDQRHNFFLIPSLLQGIARHAKEEGVSQDEFINLAVAERIARLDARSKAQSASAMRVSKGILSWPSPLAAHSPVVVEHEPL